jgi:PadR family transcriptional regulator PadR
MSSFSDKGLLGELEQLVLLAVMHQDTKGNDAYAVSIADEIESRTGIALARGSIYVALHRLDRKGYLTSRLSDPTPERGGKAKRCFSLTASGARALRMAEQTLDRMRAVRPARASKGGPA